MKSTEIHAHRIIGITDFKRSDTSFIEDLQEPVAILKRDEIKAYLIPASLMEELIDKSKFNPE